MATGRDVTRTSEATNQTFKQKGLEGSVQLWVGLKAKLELLEIVIVLGAVHQLDKREGEMTNLKKRRKVLVHTTHVKDETQMS